MIPLIKNKKTAEYDSAFSSKLWLFENVEKEEYSTQLEEIKNNGFAFVYETNIEGNVTNVFTGDEGLVLSSFYPCDNTVRTVFEKNKNLPEHKMREDLIRSSKTTLWQFEVDHSLIDCGMCYIIRTCDGSFFIVDSAHTYSCRDDERIHSFLRERTPKGEKIRIAGWFFSHGHDDHIAQFTNFLKYCSSDVEIEGLYFNFPTYEHRDAHEWMGAGEGYVKQFREAIEKRSDIPVYTLHSGECFYVRNLKFDVLCSHEDVFPASNLNYNDSSVVLMMTAEGTKVCFPGDAGHEESYILEKRYPSFLKADIVQQAHHGHFGTTKEFYRLVDADLVLFPVTQIIFDQEYKVYEENKYAIDLAEGRYHIASNGTVEVDLPYVKGSEKVYPDETFENFKGINDLWGYQYDSEYKQRLYNEYLARGGKPIAEYENGF
jgi:beta-lactamase superfamily II metal-dependent hydrolase